MSARNTLYFILPALILREPKVVCNLQNRNEDRIRWFWRVTNIQEIVLGRDRLELTFYESFSAKSSKHKGLFHTISPSSWYRTLTGFFFVIFIVVNVLVDEGILMLGDRLQIFFLLHSDLPYSKYNSLYIICWRLVKKKLENMPADNLIMKRELYGRRI